MIKRRKKKRNPYIVKYGYHLTNEENLKKILKEGLRVHGSSRLYLSQNLQDIGKYFFEEKRPIYFLDIPNINKLTKSMHDHIDNSKYNRILKVNVEDYDQQPDYNMLVIDYGFNMNLYDEEFTIFDYNYDKISYKPLRKLLKKYENDGDVFIPLKDLNEELQTEFIFFTETFCINENIPANRIEEVIEII